MKVPRGRIPSGLLPGNGSPRAVAGFTLIELVLVVAILGILAAVMGPKFFSVSDVQLHFFRDDTLSAVRFAQKLAVARGCSVQVTTSANAYTLNGQDGCSGSSFTQSVADPGTGGPGYTGTAPTGVTLTSTLSPILFERV